MRLSLCTVGRHTEGAEVHLHTFLTWAVDGGEWSKAQLGSRVTCGERSYVTAGWASDLVWKIWKRDEFLVRTGITYNLAMIL